MCLEAILIRVLTVLGSFSRYIDSWDLTLLDLQHSRLLICLGFAQALIIFDPAILSLGLTVVTLLSMQVTGRLFRRLTLDRVLFGAR
jgi:hypothetical protein